MATIGSDAFLEAVNTNLNAHTPDVGGAWTLEFAQFIVNAVIDRVRHNRNALDRARKEDDIGDDDMDVTAKCSVNSSTARIAGVCARMSTDGFADQYEAYLQFKNSTTQDVFLFKNVGGVRTQLGTGTATLAQDVQGTLKLSIRSGTQEVFVDSVSIIATTEANSTLIGRQYAGILMNGNAGANATLDDFLSESVTASTSRTPSVGALALSGLAAALIVGTILQPATGSLVLTGSAPASGATTRTPSAGTLTLTGIAPTVSSSSATTRTPSTGALTLSGVAPRIPASYLQPATGALSLTGAAPTRLRSDDASVDRYSPYDLDALSVAYRGRLLNSADLTILREIPDPLWSPVPAEAVTLELDNTDGGLTADYLAGLAGRVVTVTRYDVRSAVSTEKFAGIVTWPRLGEHRLTLECGALDGALFTELVPEPTVETDTFPSAADVGATVPVVFGNVTAMPCPNVCDDRVGSLFDYLVGHGSLAVTGLARNGKNEALYPVAFSECVRAAGGAATSWAEVARTDLYAGYTVVRFTLRQQDFNNALHRIYADVTGMQAERNFAKAVRTFCEDATWGLGQTCNATSFDAAEAVLDALPIPLYCDGAMLSARKAQEWLGELLMVRGMWPAMNSAGEVTLTVDEPTNTVAMTIGADPGDGPRNLVSVRERVGPAPEDRVRKINLRYRLNYAQDTYLNRAKRTIGTMGKVRRLTHHFLRDATSADCVADYLSKRILYGQETVEVTVTQEGRGVQVGDLVSLTKASLGYAGDILEVWKISEQLTTLTFTLRGRNWITYAYLPGTLPVDAVTETETPTTVSVSDHETGLQSTSSATLVDIPGRAATITTDGGPVMATGAVYTVGVHNATGAPAECSAIVALVRDSTVLASGGGLATIAAGGVFSFPITLSRIDTPSAGSHTYKLQFAVTSGTSVDVSECTIDAVLLNRTS